MPSRHLHRVLLLAAAVMGTPGLLHASASASANYNIVAAIVNVGGNDAASSSYTNAGSVGGIGGISTVASPTETVNAGFEGQLYEEAGLTLNARFVNNGASQQLWATEILDDGTTLVPSSNLLTWSLTAGALPLGLALNPGTGVISGSPSGPTNYSFTILATDPLGFTAQQTFTPFETYAQWISYYPQLSNPAPLATPLNDGVSNLLKYLFDINPTQPMTAADRAAMAGVGINTTSASTPGVQYLTLTYRQNQALSGVTVNLQSSPDLVNWTMVTPDLSQQIGADPSTNDPVMEVGIIIPPDTQQEFIRLNVVNQ